MEPQYVLVEEEPEPKYTRQKIAGATLAFGVLLALWIAQDRFTAAIEMSPDCVQVAEHRPATDAGVTRIYGTVKNSCRVNFGTVIVYFKLRDGAGKIIGQTQATRRDFKPGQSWEFETMGFFSPPVYELDHVMAY